MQSFELFLFTPDPVLAARAVAAGVDGIVIDWEQRGKRHRQACADTEINEDTVADLLRIRSAVSARLLCRVNAVGEETGSEIEAAVEAGADEVLLPMVRSPEEVEYALELARGRVGVGILVETVEAVEHASALGKLPLSRAFVGLNDLAIERGSRSIFSALIDGTVERVRPSFSAPFGVAGLTLPDAGYPLPCRLLVAELARLACDFTFLRRSFRRDIVGRSLETEVPRIRAALREALRRFAADARIDRDELVAAIDDFEIVGSAPALHA